MDFLFGYVVHAQIESRLPSALTILHITAPAEVGGLESVVRMLASGHRRMGHRVYVAGVIPPDGRCSPFLDALSDDGIDVVPIILPTRAYLKERAAVRHLCETLRPSVVHTHGYRSDVADAGMVHSLGTPIITTVHGFTGGGLKNRLYERLQELAFRRFDAVVAVSRAIADRLRDRAVAPERIHVIPNAFDPTAPTLGRAEARRRLQLPPDGFVVGWVGRLSAEKGPDVLINAAALTGADIHLSIIGDGPDRRSLEARAAAHGVAARVRWHGIIPAAGSLFAAFDVLVLSSRTEGIPIVLFEAMAAGTPIVATRVGGVPEVLSDREALLVPPEDPRALAAAIAAIHAGREVARVRAMAARQRLEREFALAPWLARYETLYHALSHDGADGRS